MPKIVRKAVWLSAPELEWLLAVLVVAGDDMKLRACFDRALREILDEDEKLKELVRRANMNGFIDTDKGNEARVARPKKKKESKMERKLKRMSKAQLEEILSL